MIRAAAVIAHPAVFKDSSAQTTWLTARNLAAILRSTPPEVYCVGRGSSPPRPDQISSHLWRSWVAVPCTIHRSVLIGEGLWRRRTLGSWSAAQLRGCAPCLVLLYMHTAFPRTHVPRSCHASGRSWLGARTLNQPRVLRLIQASKYEKATTMYSE